MASTVSQALIEQLRNIRYRMVWLTKYLKKLSIRSCNLVVFGPMGSGKRASFNTIVSALCGKLALIQVRDCNHAGIGEFNVGGMCFQAQGNPARKREVTTMRLSQALTWHTVGNGFDHSDVPHVVTGLSKQDVGIGAVAHCAIVLITARLALNPVGSTKRDSVIALVDELRQLGIMFVVGITKCDRVSPTFLANPLNAVQSADFLRIRTAASTWLRVPTGHFFPLASYHDYDTRDEAREYLALRLYERALHIATGALERYFLQNVVGPSSDDDSDGILRVGRV